MVWNIETVFLIIDNFTLFFQQKVKNLNNIHQITTNMLKILNPTKLKADF